MRNVYKSNRHTVDPQGCQGPIDTCDIEGWPPLHEADLFGVRTVCNHNPDAQLPLELLDRPWHGRVGVM